MHLQCNPIRKYWVKKKKQYYNTWVKFRGRFRVFYLNLPLYYDILIIIVIVSIMISIKYVLVEIDSTCYHVL